MIERLKALANTAKGKTATLGASAALVVYGPAVQAAPAIPDVSEGVTFLEGLLVPIGLLGAAFLIVSIAIKGWKIMRSV